MSDKVKKEVEKSPATQELRLKDPKQLYLYEENCKGPNLSILARQPLHQADPKIR